MDDNKKKHWFVESLEAVVPALVIVVIINVFLGQTRRVDGLSMEPGLEDHQRIIMEKISYRFHPPERGDIIVLQRPDGAAGHPLIKRVIGLPGDTVEIRDGGVWIDAERLDEPYLDQPTFGYMAPQLVPENHVFVLGDNRGSSNDSRAFGMVLYDDILGKAWIRYWPLDQIGLIN